jgi:hypothetical protein
MIIAEHLVSQLRKEYDIILSAITFAQKGILLPQIVTPEDITEAFQLSQSTLPTGLSLPSTARVAYKHVLMDIVDIDVFLNDNILGYILRIPLVHSVVYNLYKLMPFPTKVRNSEDTFVFISSEEDYLLLDTSKQIYAKLSDLQASKCKTISPELRMCKQAFPLKSTNLYQECEAKLLEPTITIPPDCNKKIITLNEVVWLPLSRNKWIFASPKKEKVTILCNSLDPSDVIVQGTGMLSMSGRCDAFGPSTKIQTESTFTSNRTDKDIVPEVTLQYDCCEHLGSKLKLYIVKGTTKLPLKNLHSHSNAFKYAGRSTDKVERLILHSEAELRRENSLNQLNFLSYIGIATIVVILLLCCFYKKCIYWKRWMNDDCCGRICIRQTVINQRDVIV